MVNDIAGLGKIKSRSLESFYDSRTGELPRLCLSLPLYRGLRRLLEERAHPFRACSIPKPCWLFMVHYRSFSR